jgi:hypothetical protein
MPASFHWTKEQIQAMIKAYAQGQSVTLIAKRYGTSHQVIGPVLKKQGVVLREHHETMRRHTCNHAYFHEIDSEEKAYWLGFLTADGCITTGNRISVGLAQIDFNHLLKLKRCLDASQMISSRARGDCNLVICSPQMSADLAMHGILPNKTFSTKPVQVKPDLERHYWRGVIDGDGTFAKGGSDLKLCGDYEVVIAFQAFVLSHCPEVRAKVYKAGNIFAFTISKRTTVHILEVLYGDATISLERKYERAMKILHR